MEYNFIKVLKNTNQIYENVNQRVNLKLILILLEIRTEDEELIDSLDHVYYWIKVLELKLWINYYIFDNGVKRRTIYLPDII